MRSRKLELCSSSRLALHPCFDVFFRFLPSSLPEPLSHPFLINVISYSRMDAVADSISVTFSANRAPAVIAALPGSQDGGPMRQGNDPGAGDSHRVLRACARPCLCPETNTNRKPRNVHLSLRFPFKQQKPIDPLLLPSMPGVKTHKDIRNAVTRH
jgi:hypothetical protein